jgi:hypothetical protein
MNAVIDFQDSAATIGVSPRDHNAKLTRPFDAVFTGEGAKVLPTPVQALHCRSRAVRQRFDEARWVRWNLVRAVASMAAFGRLDGGLVRSYLTRRELINATGRDER